MAVRNLFLPLKEVRSHGRNKAMERQTDGGRDCVRDICEVSVSVLPTNSFSIWRLSCNFPNAALDTSICYTLIHEILGEFFS
jgi:hypothetical protein